MTDGPTVAVTGAAGFIGSELVRRLLARGARVRALVRSATAAGPGLPENVEIVAGDLSDDRALRRLCEGTTAVIHLAGLVKALKAADFDRVNRRGALDVASAARETAPDARFVLVSSLAAREPQLSPYAASKRAAEAEVMAVLGAERAIVARPVAVYGPGDRELLPLFRRVAAGRTVPDFSRPGARLAMIHVADAAVSLANLALGRASPGIWTLSDNRRQGYTWREIIDESAAAVGRSPARRRPVPAAALHIAAVVSAAWSQATGAPAMLSPGKAREALHADWSVEPGEWPPFREPARFTLREGFMTTVAWYRSRGLLPE